MTKKKDEKTVEDKANTEPDTVEKQNEVPEPLDTAEEKNTSIDTAPLENTKEIASPKPVAIEVTLREIYPQESYGRCGLRFKKGQMQRIALAAFEPEALNTLTNDPWLAITYVTN